MTNDYGEINGDTLTTDSGSITISTPTYTMDPRNCEYTTPKTACEPSLCPSSWSILNKKGGDDMRYLYEVILVNPKNDEFYQKAVVARSETSALMEAYKNSQFCNIGKVSETRIAINVEFDDLKTSCRVLMEWKKEKSLKKAIETIKEAVE